MRNLKFTLLFSFIFSLPVWAQVVNPPNRTQTTSTQPTISADFNSRVDNARIWVDGTEFTHYLRTRGDSVTLVPPYNLDYGRHQVQLQTDNNRQLAWSFDIVHGYNNQTYYPNNNPNYYPNNNPNNNPNYYPNDPNYYPNNDPYYNDNQRYDPNRRDDNNSIDLGNILQVVLPRILQNRY